MSTNYKAKLEAQAHKKMYKDLLLVLYSKSTTDLCKGMVMYTIMSSCVNFFLYVEDPNASISLLLLRRLVNSKMPKQSEETLVILEVGKFNICII